jgi:hypothetical protein
MQLEIMLLTCMRGCKIRIEEMLVRDIKYDKRPHGRNKPDLQEMRAEERNEYESKITTYKREDYKFEKRVFNYLFENRNELGIKKIYALQNMRVDGLLKLDNERIMRAHTKSNKPCKSVNICWVKQGRRELRWETRSRRKR